ncbi:MAG: ABC transporter permease [Chloroflexi bacterium]|nr:ABC transporter permease [Chloroflexota bacterium]
MRRLPVQQLLLEWGLVIVIAAAMIGFTIVQPRFATIDNAQNVLRQLAPLALLAAGQAIVLIVGGVDISIGSTIALSSVMMVYSVWWLGTIPGIIVGVLTGAVVGVVNGFIIAKWKVNAFVITLAMMTAIRGFALQITGGIPLHGNIPDDMLIIGNGFVGPIPIPLIIAAAGFVFLYLFLNRTPVGRHLYAIGGNELAARLAGIKIFPAKVLAYVLCGAFAGMAGVILSSRGALGGPNMGQGFELDAIAAAVIGGVAFGGGEGKVRGVILGVLLLSVIKNGLNMYNVSSFIQLIVIGLIIASAIVVDRYRYRGEA